MAALSTLMAVGFGAQAIGGLTNSIAQAQAQEAQGDYLKSRYEANARIADIQGADALKRGDEEASQIRRKAKLIQGSQRAAAAAQGIEADTGSAGDLQGETQMLSALDELKVKNNAWREAWGYKVSANDLRGQAEQAYISSRGAARNTLVTGGLNAIGTGIQAGYYYGRKA